MKEQKHGFRQQLGNNLITSKVRCLKKFLSNHLCETHGDVAACFRENFRCFHNKK